MIVPPDIQLLNVLLDDRVRRLNPKRWSSDRFVRSGRVLPVSPTGRDR